MLRSNIISIFFASVFFVLLTKSVFAAEFLCTKYSNVNFRNGPGVKFAIVYKVFKKGYPVKVIDTIDEWHAVEDFKGDKMWVSSSNLASKCGKIVNNAKLARVRFSPEETSPIFAELENGFVINRVKCYKMWCEVTIEGKLGWILRESLWE